MTEILSQAVQGNLTGTTLRKIVNEKAFAESGLVIPDALENGTWKLLDETYETPLRNPPKMPMTLLQKRWLKALLLDPRIRLFAPDTAGLEEVKPLFTPDMFVYFDRYGDGDPFDDADYVEHFRTILLALREKKHLEIQYVGKHGTARQFICLPERLEYSAKDDKFRLVYADSAGVINLARIVSCQIAADENTHHEAEYRKMEKGQVTFDLIDERGALERVLLHFSHLEKETKRLNDHTYRVILYYDKSDETEILIRILSFGAKVQVIEPEEFIEKIRKRLARQLSL